MAKGKLDISVHGLALGVPLASVSIGPFAQFQNCDDSADALTKLVEQLIRRLPNAEPDHETVMGQVTTFKTKVHEILATEGESEGDADIATGVASSAKLFEEIKVMFQDLPSRIESVGETRRFRGRRLHPGMLEEFVMMSTHRGEPDVAVTVLIMTSFLRDDVPWLYTMAVELYRASLAGDRAAMRRAYRAFVGDAESLERGLFMHELMGPSRREVAVLMHELPRFLHQFGPELGQSADDEGAERGS